MAADGSDNHENTQGRLRAYLKEWVWAARLVARVSPRHVAGLVVVTLVRGVIPAGLALTIRGLINSVLLAMQEPDTGLEPVVIWLVVGFVLAVLEGVGLLFYNYLFARLTDEMNVSLTSDILDHAVKLDLAFFEDTTRRELIERAQWNISQRLATFATDSLSAITNALQAFSLVVVLAVIEPLVLLVVGPLAIPYIYFQWRLSKARYREDEARVAQRRWNYYFTHLLTQPRFIPEIRLLGLGPHMAARFREVVESFRTRNQSIYRRALRGNVIFAVVAMSAFYIVFARVVLRAIRGSLTLGDVGVFGGATVRLRGFIERAIQRASGAFEQALYVTYYREFMSVVPEERVQAGAKLAPAFQGRIAAEGVTFSYPGAAAPTLRDISFSIEPGETIALVGESGAGKTSLVKLLTGLYAPQAGIIRFDGQDIRSIAPADLRRRIGCVMQHFGKYEATLSDNIAFGDWARLADEPEAVARIAHEAGLDELIARQPKGLDTHLGRLFGESDLSEGQWQQIAMARVLARNASILILDEPTAHLDARTEYNLFQRFQRLAHGRTTLLVSHRFSTISMADRIFVMQDGRITESGSHHDLMKEDGLYAELYHRHALQTAPAGN